MYITIMNLSIKQKDKLLILDNIDNFSYNKILHKNIIIQFKLTSIPLPLSVFIQLYL